MSKLQSDWLNRESKGGFRIPAFRSQGRYIWSVKARGAWRPSSIVDVNMIESLAGDDRECKEARSWKGGVENKTSDITVLRISYSSHRECSNL